MTKTICIFHGNCADGFTAAWAVWKALGSEVEFVPGHYGEAPPNVAGADVIMVDFSYKRPVLEVMSASARSILILDHHKTAQADLVNFGYLPHGVHAIEEWQRGRHGDPSATRIVVQFDMDRSGAQIAWDFFHHAQPRPELVDYVADRDLWKFALPRSRDVAAWVFSHQYDFSVWDRLSNRLSGPGMHMAMEEGAAIERKHHKDVAELLKVTRREMVIGGHIVPVANLPYTMASDAAGLMAEDAPFAACYYDRPDARVFSLRSRGEVGLDVSAIAESYGGGGHRNASGFQVPLGWEGDRYIHAETPPR